MTRKEDPEKVVDLTFVPVRSVVERADGWHGRGFIGVGLHADARVVAYGEQIVDDFEAVGAGGEVNGGDIHHRGEFGGSVIFEECEDGNDAGWGDVDCELVLPDGESVEHVSILRFVE